MGHDMFVVAAVACDNDRYETTDRYYGNGNEYTKYVFVVHVKTLSI